MDILLLIGSIICLLVGLAGAVLPLPGPPLSLIGLFMLHYSKYADFDRKTLIFFTLVTIGISIFDYYAPIWGTKKFGGTKYGTWGSTIGLLVGLFIIPGFGMFLGAFLGAFLGEILGKAEPKKALKAAIGSFLGLIAGIFGKVLLCLAMLILACIAIGEYFMIML
ncbi:DUF456 domain-containing protein [Arcicella rosea]|uniref:Uncharacterized protein YqgC (DUF456 family) n=1 Tax=Arcicella rosea TaxID=502909 RepID=A0A841EFK8_9BACT|nr:DUF456 domain-containing protein [Arcicella rosea]MBB6001786.1 uncharacterized protein YqgC (DUF456 family) [Arcicella rosea]